MAGPAAAELRLICPVSQTWPYLLGHIFLASHLTKEFLRNNCLAWSTSRHAWISNFSPSSPVASPEAKLWLVTYPHQQGHQPIHSLSFWPLIIPRADDLTELYYNLFLSLNCMKCDFICHCLTLWDLKKIMSLLTLPLTNGNISGPLWQTDLQDKKYFPALRFLVLDLPQINPDQFQQSM